MTGACCVGGLSYLGALPLHQWTLYKANNTHSVPTVRWVLFLSREVDNFGPVRWLVCSIGKPLILEVISQFEKRAETGITRKEKVQVCTGVTF